jgi:hypothetical protein
MARKAGPLLETEGLGVEGEKSRVTAPQAATLTFETRSKKSRCQYKIRVYLAAELRKNLHEFASQLISESAWYN